MPLLNDIIQIGVAGELPTGTIEVAKTPSTIAVRRTDGKPLQAQVLQAGEGESTSRTAVFQTPVDSLKLLRVPGIRGSGLWIVIRGGWFRRRRELIQLVQTIIVFGSAKQRREHSRSHEKALVPEQAVSDPQRSVCAFSP